MFYLVFIYPSFERIVINIFYLLVLKGGFRFYDENPICNKIECRSMNLAKTKQIVNKEDKNYRSNCKFRDLRSHG